MTLPDNDTVGIRLSQLIQNEKVMKRYPFTLANSGHSRLNYNCIDGRISVAVPGITGIFQEQSIL